MKDQIFKKLFTTYEENVEVYDVKDNKTGKTQKHRRMKTKDYEVNTKRDLEKWFEQIKEKYPAAQIRLKIGMPYNVSNMPWIQIYINEKNAKGTKGDYCGITYNKKEEKLELWVGFGEGIGSKKMKKREVSDKKTKVIKQYKTITGDNLERGFEYTSLYVDATIIGKSYKIQDFDMKEFKEDVLYLIGIYNRFISLETQPEVIKIKKDLEEEFAESKKIMGRNILFKGFPGSGKSYRVEHDYLRDEDGKLIDRNLYERITFYPEYSNAEFVGTVRPTIENYQPIYKFLPGPFTKILKRAMQNPKTNFYLVIEEINRGDAESIFGDIFQLLDRENGDGRSSYSITNSLIASEIFEDEDSKIYIPENLSIIATMNATDENVKTLDTAFERRWEVQWVIDEKGVFDDMYLKGMESIKWGDFRKVINNIIISQKGVIRNEDKQLGAYFIDKTLVVESSENNLKGREKFLYKVILYLYNKICKYDKTIIFNEKIDSINTLVKEFGGKDYINVFNDEIRSQL